MEDESTMTMQTILQPDGNDQDRFSEMEIYIDLKRSIEASRCAQRRKQVENTLKTSRKHQENIEKTDQKTAQKTHSENGPKTNTYSQVLRQ